MLKYSLAALVGGLCSGLALAQDPPSPTDALASRISQQITQLIKSERERQIIGKRGGQVDHDFINEMGALVKEYDQHVLLKQIAQSKEQGDLETAWFLVSQWERMQEISGFELDPQIAATVRAEKPSLAVILKQKYLALVQGCTPANAKDNAEYILGVARTANLTGDFDSFPQALADASTCAQLAPWYLHFTSHVEGSLTSSDVEATGLKMSFDPKTGTYIAADLPLQYTSLKTKPACWHGDGISGTLTAIGSYRMIDDATSEVVVQILPDVREEIAVGAPSRGGQCVNGRTGGEMNYWTGFVLTGGTQPFVLDKDWTKTLKGSYAAGPLKITQESTILVVR
jgi:hypothetical protein